ncbi:MAG: thrombospondin type 3 repeat-containing protein [Candidatus Doudnabacteria bacterium]|nr:thrombospondin type 3 repeat-containing protein [Candidatus Doudnabacteria bacterium]
MLGTKKTDTANVQQQASKLPKVWLNQYFNTQTCQDTNTCGDAADPDNDGLKNYDEFKAGTNPLNPDSDTDGLADGDEVNIYKTEPTLKYTDRREIVSQNNWLDGFQIKNSYDPLTPAIKFTETRKKQISDDTAKFQLHEPSITTTKSTSVASPSPTTTSNTTTNWKTYTNAGYGVEFKVPPTWIVEAQNNDICATSTTNGKCDLLISITASSSQHPDQFKEISGNGVYYGFGTETSHTALVDQVVLSFKVIKVIQPANVPIPCWETGPLSPCPGTLK